MHIYSSIRHWCKADKNRSLILIAAGVLFFVGILLFSMDFKASRKKMTEGIVRNSYGRGSREQDVDVAVKNGERTKIRVSVSERAYTEEEIKSMFQRCIAYLDQMIPGQNQTMDHVEKNLNLITSIPEVPVEIGWELDRYDVMNVYGELQKAQLKKEGTLVRLQATITYTEDSRQQARYECSAVVFPETYGKQEQELENIRRAIKSTDKKTQTESKLVLPGVVDGKEVSYFPVLEERGMVLAAMAVLIGMLLIALERQNQEQEKEKRKAQMLLDYPEIINKLTLFLGAGMTVKRAWKKIVSDYGERKSVWGVRYAYEEMYQTCNEMDSGVPETESYEKFGRRCGLQEYIRLGALLSQNLRKGTKDLNQILKTEAAQSFEERKARARILGEEAGTKLLAPMFLMLAVVLVIVIVPAFLSVQM